MAVPARVVMVSMPTFVVMVALPANNLIIINVIMTDFFIQMQYFMFKTVVALIHLAV